MLENLSVLTVGSGAVQHRFSVAAFGKYDPRADCHSGTEIDEQCCFDVKQVAHPFGLPAEVVWWCRQCLAQPQSNNL